jgi:crossover junction endodeoxyribonuclease RuvC
MKILGIDPGYDRVGWAVLDISEKRDITVIEFGCVQTDKKSTIMERYAMITKQLSGMLATHNPQEAALETIFFSKNTKTAIRVSEARGVIISTLLPFGISLTEYSPNQVKLTVTGYGTADKQAVEKMVRMQLKITEKGIIDDTIDAVAIAFTHALQRPKTL